MLVLQIKAHHNREYVVGANVMNRLISLWLFVFVLGFSWGDYLLAEEPEGIFIKEPLHDSVFEVPTASTSFSFSWTTVKGAVDYEFVLSQLNTRPRVVITTGTSAFLKDLGDGIWQVNVRARANNGSTIVKSKTTSFSIYIKQPQNPEILRPQNGDVISAYQPTIVRWRRGGKGDRSEVTIARADQPQEILHRETITKGVSVVQLPAVGVGNYLITVKDRFGDAELSQAVKVEARQDPLGLSSGRLGVDSRFLGGWIMGHYRLQNTRHSQTWVSSLNRAEVGDLLIRGNVDPAWGLDANVRVEKNLFNGIDNTSNSLYFWRARLGAYVNNQEKNASFAYPTRMGVFSRKYTHFIGIQQPVSTTDFRIYGLSFGQNFVTALGQSFWDFLLELEADIPVYSYGSELGRGATQLLPLGIGHMYLRRRFLSDWRLYFGGELRVEYLTIGEKFIRRRTKTDLISPVLQMGFELVL